jgi:phosphatidylinositol N-acetylglucosaminyltransferase subunit P
VTPTELYGFFMWILTAVTFMGYQFWAYVPENILQSLGIHYIPNKYMAVAVPAWIGLSIWCMIMIYLAHSMMHTHDR